MTQQHTGKKRRREVREAVDMQEAVKTTTFALMFILLAGILIVVVTSIMLSVGMLNADNLIISMLPVVVLFVIFLLLGTRVRRWTGMREEYKDHCRKFNITKEEMQALKRGDL